MPQRAIKETILDSRTLDRVSGDAERLYHRLTTKADDFGRFKADPIIILGNCFPLKIGVFTLEMISAWFAELEVAGAVVSYEFDGKLYGYFPEWESHQGKPRAKTSKYPQPPAPGSNGKRRPASADICTQPPTDAHTCEQMFADAGRCLHVPADVRTCKQMSPSSSSSSSSNSSSNSKAIPPLTPPAAEDPGEAAWMTKDQEPVFASRWEMLKQRYPRHWWQIDQLIRDWKRHRKPADVCIEAMASALAHDAQNPIPYLAKILRVEEPNFHERQALARHEAVKAEEARERAGPRVESGFMSVAAILGRAQGPGQ